MQFRNRGRRIAPVGALRRIAPVGALVAVACLLVAACGTSSSSVSSNPNTLLNQTFSGSHKITSGNLSITLTLDPSGSSTIKQPLTLSFGGPFQSRGKGKLPQSDFSINLTTAGRSVFSVGILSTGNAGYVKLQGATYQLPQATFKKLESNFASVGSGSSSTSTLSKLGIQPLNWLNNPTIVGTANVGGTATTHIRAGVNVPALVNGISQFLRKASSLGVSGTSRLASGLSATTQSKIASSIHQPSFDVWTGNSDKTLRRLDVGVTVPVTGKAATAFGGLNSAAIGLSIQYSNLNQAQTIKTPSNVQPYSQFAQKIEAFIQEIQGGLGSSSSSSSSTTGSGTAGSTTSSASSAATTSYGKCIAAAGSDVTKMQQCASLLQSP